jgi:hypothetical protein
VRVASPDACPPATCTSMVAAAPAPSSQSNSVRRGQRATAPRTIAVTSRTMPWLISLPPVGEPSRSPRETPTRECSATTIATSPAADRASAPPSSGSGGALARRRKTSRLLATAPTSRMSPQSSAQRPATPSTEGDGELAAAGAPPEAAEGGCTPMPKANEPLVRCPSALDTVRQLTV